MWKKEGSQFMNNVEQFNVTIARDGSEVMVPSLSMPVGTQELCSFIPPNRGSCDQILARQNKILV